MPRRAGFTMVELLAVIGIIVILMGMLFPAISIVRQQARKAKTRSLIAQLSGALEVCRNANASYPEHRYPAPSASDPFEDGLGPASDPALAAAVTVPGWEAVNRELVRWVESVTREPLPAQALRGGLVVDAWDAPLRYRPARFYPFKPGASSLIDSDRPPRPDGYQLWSIGPNKRDEQGEKDDLSEWAR